MSKESAGTQCGKCLFFFLNSDNVKPREIWSKPFINLKDTYDFMSI